MGKSIEYIKQRLPGCKFDSMHEIDIYEIIKKDDSNKIYELNTKSGNLMSEVYYDDAADFNYYTMRSNINDGTLSFMYEAARDVVLSVLDCKTYNTKVLKEAPENEDYFDSHHFKYTIGNIVCCSEYGDEFSSEEKPWMKSRFTAFLPIKFEVVESTSAL